jgi:large subunit ribosomal protein L15
VATSSVAKVPQRILSPSQKLSRRFALTRRPFFPISQTNLRQGHGALMVTKKAKKRVGRGRGGHRMRRQRLGEGGNPHPSSWDGGKNPLYRRFPKWPAARMASKKNQLEALNLSKLRYFIEKGRDSNCVPGIKNGVKIFNVNDYPFPYKINIEISGADQSAIDAIKRVGGSVTIVYMDRVGLRAHLRPYRFEILPKTARPTAKMVHYLEKMRARGCQVRYIRPLWLIEEEKRVKSLLREEAAEIDLAKNK